MTETLSEIPKINLLEKWHACRIAGRVLKETVSLEPDTVKVVRPPLNFPRIKSVLQTSADRKFRPATYERAQHLINRKSTDIIFTHTEDSIRVLRVSE